MNKKKVASIIEVFVLLYNTYDFLKALNDKEEAQLRKCKETFIKNTKTTDLIAEKYCECALEKVSDKYNVSKLSTEEILKKEQEVLQGCYNYAILFGK